MNLKIKKKRQILMLILEISLKKVIKGENITLKGIWQVLLHNSRELSVINYNIQRWLNNLNH